MQINDKDLLKSAKYFDPGALAYLFEQLSPGIFRYAYRLLGSTQNAEDCVADTFLRFLSALEAGKGPNENLKSYLFRSAHNWIVDYYRDRSITESEINDEYKDQKENVETLTENRIRIVETINALEHLTIDQKEVILLRYEEDLTIKQISRVAQKSPGAIKALLHRATNTLIKELHHEQ
jgi:RNA polymerase sigma-70 factor, ECF subfamily